jgi:DNA-binding transcriptional LysR family regulator
LNFSRTAEQFFISQPAVTHHIKALEGLLGVKLFNRTSRKIMLTDEGHEFLQYANHAIEIIESAEVRIQNMAQGRKSHIRIAALSSTIHLLSACLVQLFKEHPYIQVDVDLLEGSEIIRSVQKSNYDFYFLISDMISGADKHESLPIAGDRLELFVNSGAAGSIDMSDWSTIQKLPFVAITKSEAWLTGRIKLICKNRGLVPNIVNYYNRAEAVVMAVNAGIGAALLPGGIKRLYQHPNVVVFPIEGSDAVVVYVLAWKSGNDTPANTIFKDTVSSVLRITDDF